ncbi:TPA: hypothetical protein ACG5GM_005682, partial [Klebsiella pneumoniae]
FFYAPARGFWRLSGFMKLPGFYPSDVPAVGPSLQQCHFFYAPARGFWRLSGFMKLPGFYPSDVPAVGPSLV